MLSPRRLLRGKRAQPEACRLSFLAATAQVPLTIIMLLDCIKRRALPPELKPRVVLPTSDTISISMWDAPSAEVLLEWLNTSLQYDAVHAVHEAQEEFSYGLSFELGRLRAAEKVVAGGRDAVDKLSATAAKAGAGITKQLEALDQRSGILTAAEQAFTRVRSAASSSFPASSGAQGHSTTGHMNEKGFGEDDTRRGTAAATISANVKEGLNKASATWSWLGTALKEQLNTATASTGSTGTAAYAAADRPSAYIAGVYGNSAAGHDATTGVVAGAHTTTRPTGQARNEGEDEDHAPLMGMPQVPLSVDSNKPSAAAVHPPLPVSQPGDALQGVAAPLPPKYTLDDDK